MSRLPGFIGPSNINRSVNVDVERTVNLVWEAPSGGTPKVPASLYGRPGVHALISAGDGPIRALFAQDGRAWAISGNQLYELFASQTVTLRGTVAQDANPATICSNGGADGSGGHQLFIVSGGHGYIFDLVANTLTQITATGFPFPAFQGAFIDGYFVVLKGQSNQFNLSNLNDGLLWDALDVAEIEQWPGNIVSLVTSHNEIWPFSATKVNPWYDSAATFPFQPVLGASMEYGALAPWSVARIDNTLFWVSQNENGGPMVVRADGYSPKRVSTHAIETLLQRLPRVDDAIAFTCQMDGHLWYILYLPENDTHLVYDVASGQWSEWAQWDDRAMVWIPFQGRCHCWAYGKHLVGDRKSGVIYDLSFDYYADTAVA